MDDTSMDNTFLDNTLMNNNTSSHNTFIDYTFIDDTFIDNTFIKSKSNQVSKKNQISIHQIKYGKKNQVLQTLHDSFAKIELLKYASMFEREVNIVTKTFRTIIRDQFRNEVSL